MTLNVSKEWEEILQNVNVNGRKLLSGFPKNKLVADLGLSTDHILFIRITPIFLVPTPMGSTRLAYTVGECFIHPLCPCSEYLTGAFPEYETRVDSDFVRVYEDNFIKVNQCGAFEGSDIERNSLHECVHGTAPDFVIEFERELDGKPGLDPDVCCYLDCSSDADGSM